MNVLVLNGSPKGEKSNTMNLTRAFLEGAGYDNAEIIDISKLNIYFCQGCFGCWGYTPGKCVIIGDDMPQMLEKLINADVVVWSFPLYYYNVPGPLKTFIDRQLPLALPDMDESAEHGEHPSRYDFSRQRHVLISTCGFWTHEGNYQSIVEMFSRNYGEDGFSTLFAGQGGLFSLANMPEATDHELYDSLKPLVEKYIDTVRIAGSEWASGKISDEASKLLATPVMSKEDYERAVNASAKG
jgi:multimeric flavodoxin WrbA